MRITYANGKTTVGILLSRNNKKMRVALRGGEDVTEFTSVSGAWVSEDCEVVQVRYEWQRRTRKPVVSEADCVCSKELAAHLVHLLWIDDKVEASGRTTASQCLAVRGENGFPRTVIA